MMRRRWVEECWEECKKKIDEIEAYKEDEEK